MSAICGIFSPREQSRASSGALDSMMATLSHHGEQHHRFIDPASGLAMALLYAPTFVAPEEKPVPTWLEDDTTVLALAGTLDEIFEVFDDETGISNQAGSLQAAFERSPETLPDGFEGSFGLALWDRAAGNLVVTLDPIADKLFFYYYEPNGGFFAFASQLKAILALPSIPRDIDREALGIFLRSGGVNPPFSIIRNAHKLLPGERLTLSRDGQLQRKRYWKQAEVEKRAGRASLLGLLRFASRCCPPWRGSHAGLLASAWP